MPSAFQNMINMKARFVFLHQQDLFERSDLVNDLRKLPLHIYCICRGPRVMLDNDKCKIIETEISLTFLKPLKERKKRNHSQSLITQGPDRNNRK